MYQIDDVEIDKYINGSFDSNCYFIEFSKENLVVVIDPGDTLPIRLIERLNRVNKKVIVFLTHEHYDHIGGVDELATTVDFDLYCSKSCSESIKNPRQNMSQYIESAKLISVIKSPIIFNDDINCDFGAETFSVVLTPGHSPGGICIFFKHAVFTGDTILNRIKSR